VGAQSGTHIHGTHVPGGGAVHSINSGSAELTSSAGHQVSVEQCTPVKRINGLFSLDVRGWLSFTTWTNSVPSYPSSTTFTVSVDGVRQFEVNDESYFSGRFGVTSFNADAHFACLLANGQGYFAARPMYRNQELAQSPTISPKTDVPKKVKGRPHAPGLALRRRLLADVGFPAAIVEAAAPRGAGLVRNVRLTSASPPVSGHWMGRNISLPADADKVRFRFLRRDFFRKNQTESKPNFCVGAQGRAAIISSNHALTMSRPLRRFY
jgi:hypothetical protein